MCRPMFHVRDVVSAASEVLRSSSPYALVMPEALACRRTVLVSPDRVTCCTWNSALRRAAAGSQKSRRPLPAGLERLTYVSPIDSDNLAKRTTHAAYVLILVWARDRRSARRHGKSSSMAHIGRGVAVDAGAPMTAAYGADGHSHQRASSAEGSESLGGRSSAIVRERLFQAITVAGKGLTVLSYGCTVHPQYAATERARGCADLIFLSRRS